MNSKKSLSLKKYTISDRNILDKKTHPSLKYSNVKPKTNTGFNSEKRIEIEKEILKYYKVSCLLFLSVFFFPFFVNKYLNFYYKFYICS